MVVVRRLHGDAGGVHGAGSGDARNVDGVLAGRVGGSTSAGPDHGQDHHQSLASGAGGDGDDPHQRASGCVLHLAIYGEHHASLAGNRDRVGAIGEHHVDAGDGDFSRLWYSRLKVIDGDTLLFYGGGLLSQTYCQGGPDSTVGDNGTGVDSSGRDDRAHFYREEHALQPDADDDHFCNPRPGVSGDGVVARGATEGSSDSISHGAGWDPCLHHHHAG